MRPVWGSDRTWHIAVLLRVYTHNSCDLIRWHSKVTARLFPRGLWDQSLVLLQSPSTCICHEMKERGSVPSHQVSWSTFPQSCLDMTTQSSVFCKVKKVGINVLLNSGPAQLQICETGITKDGLDEGVLT